MGGGTSQYAAGVPQGVEIRHASIFAPTRKIKHYKFAVIQVEMLSQSMIDPLIATNCLKAINEAMNEEVESKDAKHLREELCGVGLDSIVCRLMKQFLTDSDMQREGLITIGSLAYRSEGRKARLMELGAGQCIIDTLEAHGAGKVQEEGLWAAGNLSAGTESLKVHFATILYT